MTNSSSPYKDLCERHHVKRLEIFGSATDSARFEPAKSDLDFVVDFEELSPAEHADAYFGLLKDLEMALGRSVDLVERRAIRNPFFMQSIEASSELLYAAT
jgi:predicted nucleotidyltransferase